MRFSRLAPAAALAALLLAIGGAFVGLLQASTTGIGREASALVNDPYLRRVILFTLLQATLSTLLAVGLAIPVARALARQDRFFGRALLLRLLALPPVLWMTQSAFTAPN